MRSATLCFLVSLTCPSLACADAHADPVLTEKPLAKVLRTERRTPIDFEACKKALFGSGSQQGDNHGSWSCTFGELQWTPRYAIEAGGVRKKHEVERAHVGPVCEVSLNLSRNGYGIFIEAGGFISMDEAAACIDLVARTPESGIRSPGIEEFDYLEGAELPQPEPGDLPLYEDRLIGEVATEIEFAYAPVFEDFKSRMIFRGKTMSGCKPGIGCISISEGEATFVPQGGPEEADFHFSSSSLYTPDGKGCRDWFGWDGAKHQFSWTEAYLRYSPIIQPLAPGKGTILDCAKKTQLKPSMRYFRYHSPYEPLRES
jgi:hypothetical protein